MSKLNKYLKKKKKKKGEGAGGILLRSTKVINSKKLYNRKTDKVRLQRKDDGVLPCVC